MPAPSLGWRNRLLAVVTAALAGAAAASGPCLRARSRRLPAPRRSPGCRTSDVHWNDALGRYDPGEGATTTEVNADLLLVYSIAAGEGHQGPARDDRRARLLARFLTGPQAWTEHPLAGTAPWMQRPGLARLSPNHPAMHAVFVSEAAEGLAQAYVSHAPLGLEEATVSADPRPGRAHRREPGLALAGAEAESVQLVLRGVRGRRAGQRSPRHARGRDGAPPEPASLAGASGRGRQLRPGPALPLPPAPGAREILELRLGGVREHRAGLLALLWPGARGGLRPPAQLGLLRAWVHRAIAGSWTHGGYLNWDSGLGFHRWHQRKKVPARPARADRRRAAPELQPGPEWGAWAKWLLDRGLGLHRARRARTRIPAPLAYGVHEVPQRRSNAYLAAARFEANAMRAVDAGLGARPRRPPALYAYDPARRLAVTTPRLQHRDHRGQPASRSRTAGWTRAVVRRPPGGRGEHRRGCSPRRSG